VEAQSDVFGGKLACISKPDAERDSSVLDEGSLVKAGEVLLQGEWELTERCGEDDTEREKVGD
jgi:hypothetical protein